MFGKFAFWIVLTMAGVVSTSQQASAQTKFTVQVFKSSDGKTVEPGSITLLAEDGDGNVLSISLGAMGIYTVPTGGLFNNFTLGTSPTGSKSVTLYFTRSDVVPDGTTTMGSKDIVFDNNLPAGCQKGNSIVGVGLPEGTTVENINATTKTVTVSNAATQSTKTSFTFFGNGYSGTTIPALFLVSPRAQSFYITLAQ